MRVTLEVVIHMYVYKSCSYMCIPGSLNSPFVFQIIPSIPWYTERVITNITLGGLLVLVVLRTIQYNMTKMRVSVCTHFNFMVLGGQQYSKILNTQKCKIIDFWPNFGGGALRHPSYAYPSSYQTVVYVCRVLIRRRDPGTSTRIHKSQYLPTFKLNI